MNVRELIEKLQEFPQEMEVVFRTGWSDARYHEELEDVYTSKFLDYDQIGEEDGGQPTVVVLDQ